MRRRQFLVGLTALSGCGGLPTSGGEPSGGTDAPVGGDATDRDGGPAGDRSGSAGSAGTTRVADEPTGAGAATPAELRPPTEPRDVVLSNPAARSQFVTVAVEDRGGRTVFVESRRVAGNAGHTYPDVVSAPGRYRAVVETAAGARAETTWLVSGVFSDLSVVLDAPIAVSQRVRCVPDCGALSLGGRAVGFPAGGFDPRGRRAGVELRLRNDAAAERRVAVRLAGGDRLDFRYRVPPGVTLVVPVPQRAGRTPLSVTAGDVTRTYGWAMESTPKLTAEVATIPRFSCGPRSRDVVVESVAASPREVSLRATAADGAVEVNRTVTVDGGETRRLREAVPTAGRYRVQATVGDATAVTDWETCPPRGAPRVVVGTEDVSVRSRPSN